MCFFLALLGRLNDVSKQLRHDALYALRDIFIHLRASSGGRHSSETKFVHLVAVLSSDEDEPSSQKAAKSKFVYTWPILSQVFAFVFQIL